MTRVAVLTALFVLATVLAVGSVAGQSATAYVSNVTVAPEQPAPGERFTVRATVRNAESSDAAIEITDAYLRTSGGNGVREYARTEDLGSIPPGAQMTVPLTLSFDSPGSRDLRLFVVGRTPNGTVRLTTPVVVSVREGGPQLSVETDEAVVGTPTPVTVTAVNGEDEPVRNVRLTLDGENVRVENATRVLPTLASGATQTFPFELTPTAEGASLTATLGYTTASGDSATVREEISLRTAPLREDVSLDASVPGEGSTPPVVVAVSNFGNAPLSDVAVRAEANGSTVARRPLAPIPPGATLSADLNVSGGMAGDVTVVADYETGDRTGSARTTLDYRPNPGRVELTGVDVERAGDRIHVTGSASNVGLSEVNSVVVRVVPAEGVEPARPYREYFVGTIPASDFVSFDAYARLDPDADASSVPVRVTYLVDGEERSVLQQVPVDDLPPVTGNDGGPSPPPVLLVVGVLALAAVGLAAYAYRTRR